LPGVIVSGLTETDIASQIPPGRADDPSRRQTALNVALIHPMKKILTTLTVIAAAALGAQGQTTIEIPNTGSSSLTNLTLDPSSFNPPVTQPYKEARLFFSVSAIPSGVTVTLSGITLTGDGISSSLSYSDVTLNSTETFRTLYQNLNSTVRPWTPDDSRVSFNVQISGGALAPLSSLGYGVTYRDLSGDQVATSPGNLSIVAVPEPSTYAAAAGLLALFLWSSRRHLFKLAGARSSASGSDENGAA
jgi:hypothetical protein